MRILIVEDEAITRALIHDAFSTMARCDLAVNGEEAVAAVTAALDEGDPYDLISLDIELPVLNGHQVLDAIRSEEARRSIPARARVAVIMVTGSNDPENLVRALKGHCDGFLQKPFSREVLQALIEV